MLEDQDLEAVRQLNEAYDKITTELNKVIVGQKQVIEELLVALFARGHCLLVGVPGLAKTLLIHTLADALSLQFSRIQFTPDLMPSDITGTELLHVDPETSARSFRFEPGPLFTNVVLADEINRTPPKTQAALLEAMVERQVTSAGTCHELPDPFFVLATQNPIEQEGTYPLPEAQLDRFMFMVQVNYPSHDEEREILKRTTGNSSDEPSPVVNAAQLKALQETVRAIPIADHVLDYCLAITRGTRVHSGEPLPFLTEWVNWGAGPRASQFLVLGAKVRAALEGRDHVAIEDVRWVAHPVMRHRIVTSFSARAEGITSDHVIDRIIEEVDPSSGVAAGVPGVAGAGA